MLLTTCLYLVVILMGTVGIRKMMIWREGSSVKSDDSVDVAYCIGRYCEVACIFQPWFIQKILNDW